MLRLQERMLEQSQSQLLNMSLAAASMSAMQQLALEETLVPPSYPLATAAAPMRQTPVLVGSSQSALQLYESMRASSAATARAQSQHQQLQALSSSLSAHGLAASRSSAALVGSALAHSTGSLNASRSLNSSARGRSPGGAGQQHAKPDALKRVRRT
ncbi:hypothetical protein RI367_008275 [Sorochytrium milnesiophthora]